MAFPDFSPAPAALSFGPHTATLLQTFLQACASDHTRRAYAKALADLDDFAAGRPLCRLLLLDWRRAMHRTHAPATVNQRLTAARKFIQDARRAQLVSAQEAASLLDVSNLPQSGARTGTWLTSGQAVQLLAVPDRTTLRGKRNYAVLAILLGCALRRSELANLTVEHLQMRDERWVIENLRGKGGRVRQVAIPTWVKDAIAAWMWAAEIRTGPILRQLTDTAQRLSDDTIMEIVTKAAARIGIQNFTPHDLRRTCAKLARKNGGELEQIQFLLGHASLVTTERYLGSTQNLKQAVNDSLGF